MPHTRFLASILSQPWALMPEAMAAYASILAKRESSPQGMDDYADEPQTHEQRQAASAARAKVTSRSVASGIAVLPLYGTIMQRGNMMSDLCQQGTSTMQFTSMLREALADDSVGQILIDIDSPGGSVYGCGELASEIMQARSQKPIIGFANSLAASAAYWIGSACTEMYVTPGGEVGSIGVWQAHEDWSKALEDAGVKTTLISAGKFKTEGNPYQVLGDDAQSFMSGRVNDYYAAFTKSIAKGRNVSIGQVRDGMGQGRVLGAETAKAENMVDGIATFDDVVKSMQRNMKSSKTGASRLAQSQNALKLLG